MPGRLPFGIVSCVWTCGTSERRARPTESSQAFNARGCSLPKEREHLGQLILIALTAAMADTEAVLAFRHARGPVRPGGLPADRESPGLASLFALEPVLFEP